jgi:hypothetical protein
MSLYMGDLEMYCQQFTLPARTTQMMKLTMFGDSVEYSGMNVSPKSGTIKFVLDEYGFTRYFFEAAKDLTGGPFSGVMAAKLVDPIYKIITKKMPTIGFLGGINALLGSLTSPTFDFLLLSLSSDKRTITDGTMLHNVQVTGLEEIPFNLGGTDQGPMMLGVKVSWDTHVNDMAAVASVLSEGIVAINGASYAGAVKNVDYDWAKFKAKTNRTTFFS